ncbi:SigB/SigF/SigG family RNA polymerase sigma factor [Nocardiopsis mangrovi]|uniref:SigB/SigF/SigG family RNA polymerase sigma factor n=1 Tax=Nocardiopsis mangrovi TaxID=1179818 RepID=A0ABV9DWN7_9ACTN
MGTPTASARHRNRNRPTAATRPVRDRPRRDRTVLDHTAERPAAETAVSPASAEDLLGDLARLAPRHTPGDADKAARIRTRVVEMYTPLARGQARRYRGRGEPAADLEQVAMLGLMKAISGYDPGHGKPFISYLLPTVTGELKRHFRDTTWAIRVPRKHQEKRAELNRFTEEFTQEHGRTPTTPETAEALGLDVRETNELLEAATAYSALSLDAPRGTDDDGDPDTLADALGEHDDDLQRVIDREALKAALATLPDRRRRIMLMRYFGNKTQSEIAGTIGVSQMQISRLIRQTLDELHTHITGQN